MTDESEVDRLRADLGGVNADRRLSAADKLVSTPELARQLAPDLLSLSATKDESLREIVMGAIEAMGAPSASRAEEIATFLAGQETQAYWAATLLGRLGGAAGFSAGKLGEMLGETATMAVRERCAWALGQIGPAAKEALPALAQAATSSSPRLARFAREAITAIGGN